MQDRVSLPPHLPPWWHTSALERVLLDLTSAELRRLRPGWSRTPFVMPWSACQPLLLSLDSIEVLQVFHALYTMFQFTGDGLPVDALQTRGLHEWLAVLRERLDNTHGTLAFCSSGSTGLPCCTVHTAETLVCEVGALQRVVPQMKRVTSLVSSHHLYGFMFTVLLPHVWCAEVVDARMQMPADVVRQSNTGDCVIGHPLFWRMAAATHDTWPAGVTGVTSGGPCQQSLDHDLRRRGLCRLVDVYGATETGGIAWRDTLEAPFELFAHWQQAGLDHLRRLAGTADANVSDALHVLLPDVVSWTDATHLMPLHRRDKAVQVAGVNVYPEYVKAKLLAHPAVADASVRLMRPDEGERLKAFIVPTDVGIDTESFCRSLDGWLGAQLTAAEQPRAFTFGSTLPQDERGKPRDWNAWDAWVI